MQTRIEKELLAARENGERSQEELKELLKEENEVEKGTRDRLSEIANLLKQQYTDPRRNQISVVKETFKVEGEEDVVRFRPQTEEEKRNERIERGETTLKDAFMNNEIVKGFRLFNRAEGWVKEDDQGITATLIRKILGETKDPRITKETETFHDREQLQNELTTERTKEIVKAIKDIPSKIEHLRSITKETETFHDRELRIEESKEVVKSTQESTKEIVKAIKDSQPKIEIPKPVQPEREQIKGDTAIERENKAEELSLFQRQNKLLQGIYENTQRLIKSTNGLQALKESMLANSEGGGGLFDTITNLYMLKKGGDILKRIPDKIGKIKVPNKAVEILSKSKDVLSKGGNVAAQASKEILTKGKDIATKTTPEVLSKSKDILGKGAEIGKKGVDSFATLFEKGKGLATKAATSNAAKGVLESVKANTSTLLKTGAEAAKTGASKIPVVGTLVSGMVNAYDYNEYADDLDQQVKEGKITKAEAENQKTVKKGSAIGSTIGAGIGTTLGLALGPIGSIVGGMAGEYLGDKIGGFIGGWFKEEEKTKVEPKETSKESPNEVKVAPTEGETPKTVHEKFIERQEKLANGEIVRRFGNKVQLENKSININKYNELVKEEEGYLRKMDKYKDLSDTEINRMAKQNVYHGNELRYTLNYEKEKAAKVASLTEDQLAEYNKTEREKYNELREFTPDIPEYKEVTMEDVKAAKKRVKELETGEGLQTLHEEIMTKYNEGKDFIPQRKVYQTKDKAGNVVSETIMMGDKVVSEVDNSGSMTATEVTNTANYSRMYDHDNPYKDLEGKIITNPNEVKVAPTDWTAPTVITNVNEVGVNPSREGVAMNAAGEQTRQAELENAKEVKVQVNNTNVNNTHQTPNETPMYSQNNTPSYLRAFGKNDI